MSANLRPPPAGRWLLRLCRLGSRRPEIEADLAELFAVRVRSRGPAYARRRYFRDVVSLVWRAADVERTPVEGASVRSSIVESIFHDIRYSMRALARQPAFFAIASLTLALGFGANVAVFAVVDRLFLSAPAHVAAADRVVRVHPEVAEIGGGRFVWFQSPYITYQELRQDVRGFERVAAYRRSRGSLGTGADARPVTTMFADSDYFTLLGVTAAIGRFFDESEDRPPQATSVLVLGYSFWQAAMGGDRSIVGRDVRLGARTYTVIGIAPRDFTGDSFEPVDVRLPLHAVSAELAPNWRSNPVSRSFTVLARLAPGVSQETAAAEASASFRQILAGTPNPDPTARVLLGSLSPGRRADGSPTPEGQVALWLEGVSLLVLAVALANVINLQLTRTAQRRRDTAVRVALGISRTRLLRQTVSEMAILAVAATTVAVVVAVWSADALQRLMTPAAGSVTLNGRVLGLAVACAAAAALICGVIAAVNAWAPQMVTHLRSGRGGDGGRHSRLRPALLIVQVGVSVVLLVGAGLFVRSMARLNVVQFGMDPDRILVVSVPLRHAGFTSAAIESFYERALAELAALPGVEHVSAGQTTPFSPSLFAEIFIPGFERVPFENNYPTYYAVTPGHFETVGMRIIRGRGFTDRDRAGTPPVMIVEEALGNAIWPGQDPVGKCLHVGSATGPCREIVGVTSNTRRFVAIATGALRYYLPLSQRIAQVGPQAMLVRPSGDPVAAIPSIRAALQRLAPDLPYAQIRVLRELAEPETRPWRLGSTLLSVFGLIALAVATFGVYGLLSAFVAQRTREMGVRIALGATPRSLVRLVVSQTMIWTAGGILLGIAGAAAGVRFIEPLLFETRAYDPLVFAVAPVLMIAVAITASAAPAWRATRVDPNLTLRGE